MRPDPLPDALVRARARVARDFGVAESWLNTAVADQWETGLPPGLGDRLQWKRYGGLHVGLVGREDLISFKLFAAVDSGGPESIHYQDLLALEPSRDDLSRAAAWVRTQDASPAFSDLVDQVIERALHDSE